MREFNNIKRLLNFKHIIEFEEIKDENINNDKFKLIDNLMLKYKHYTPKMQVIIKQNFIKNLNINFSNSIINDEKTIKINLLKNISFKLNDIKNIIDSEDDTNNLIKELSYNIEDDKFKCYVALWFMVKLGIPIFKNRIFTKEEFEIITSETKNILNLEYKKNKRLLKAYLGYLNYTKSSIEKLLTNTDSKAVIILIKNIVSVFGMKFQFKEDKNKTKKHKYILDLKTKFRKNMSIYKQSQKIPLINHEEIKINNVNDELRQKIYDIEKLILNPLK